MTGLGGKGVNMRLTSGALTGFEGQKAQMGQRHSGMPACLLSPDVVVFTSTALQCVVGRSRS